VARTSNNRVIMACELYCCLLPQCEALRICRSGCSIATVFAYLDHGSPPHTVTLSLFQIKLLKFLKSNPKIVLQNIMPIRKPKLV